MASTISAGLTTTTALVYTADTSGVLQLQTNGTTTAVTIDTNQNVGIGVTPSAWGIGHALQISGSTGFLGFSGVNGNTVTNSYYDGSNYKYIANGYAELYAQSAGQHQWYVAPSGSAGGSISAFLSSPQMTLDNSGNLLVGTTSALGNGPTFSSVGNSNNIINLNNTGGNYTTLAFYDRGTYKSQIYYQVSNSNFYVQNGASGGVYLATNATSWTAVSDERLKENLVPIENALTKVNGLRAVIGNYTSDENKKPTPFLIAQDVQAVFPQAVSTTQIKSDETNTEYLGLQYTEMIPLLVASIKELSAKVTALEAKVA